MSERKFYRSVVQVEVLSEEPLKECLLTDLDDLNYLTSEGDCSGDIKITVHNEEVNGPRMALLLQEQRSDPSFFGLTDDGNDIDIEENC